MRKLRLLKIILLLSIPTILLLSFNEDPNALQNILKKMQLFHSKNPQEKLYVHFDKPFYAAGENMWFKAYVVEASLHSIDSQSRVMYVELINQDKIILDRKMLNIENGLSFGDFLLPDTLQQGKYLVRAYTNYMKNVGEDFFFLKEFSVLNPNTTEDDAAKAEIKFSPDSIDLQFFPEGGNLVACGTFNRIAFKALAPDGKSIAIEGEILDETNAVVASFQTQHDGMGLVKLNPTSGKKYTARILKPYQVKRWYPLPRVQDKGFVMQVDEIGKNIKVVIFTSADKPASGKLDISLVAQSRGKVYHAQSGIITNTAFFTYIPRSKFPEGITQITLFDSEGHPLAERLIHQDQGESILIDLKTESHHEKRSQVTVYTDAMYRNGEPASGSFSISVYDDKLIQSPDKYPLSITNYLSLTSDLKGHIENPGYYFKDSEPETKKNLDLLMMVHGWRRFTWKDVLEENNTFQAYNREHGIPIKGTIRRALGKKAPIGSNVKILAMIGSAVDIKPDSLGRFYSDHLLYFDTTRLVIQTENEKGRKQPYRFLLDPMDPPPTLSYSILAFTPFNASHYVLQQSEQNALTKAGDATLLKAVDIVAKKERDPRLIGMGGDAIDMRKIAANYTNIFDMLRARIPGFWVNGTPPNITVQMRGKAPVFLMDGSQYPIEMVSLMSPTDIEKVEVLRASAVYGNGGNAINLILMSGAWDRYPTIGVSHVTYPGFYKAREFYSPKYDVPDSRHDLPDKRTTLFWEPMIDIDNTGRIAFTFFTADVTSHYRIVMEGITPDGYPGTGTITFEVK